MKYSIILFLKFYWVVSFLGIFFNPSLPLLFKEPFQWAEWYYLVLQVCIGLFLFAKLKIDFSFFKNRPRYSDLIFILLVLVFKVSYIHKHFFWLDEWVNVLSSSIDLPVRAGYSHHQPPMFAAFTSLLAAVKTQSADFYRSFIILFSIFGSIVLLEILKKIKIPTLICYLIVTVFTFNRLIIQYSYEFRPYAVIVTLLLINLYSLYHIFNDQDRKDYLKILLISSMFSLLTLSFQPLLIHVFILIVLLLLYLKKEISTKNYFIVAMPLFLYLPLAIATYLYSPKVFTGLSGMAILNFFKNIVFLDRIYPYQWTLPFVDKVLLCIVFVVVGQRFFLKKKLNHFSLSVVFICLFVFLTFPAFYYSYINFFWDMSPRYYIALVPLLFICVTAVIFNLFANKKLNNFLLCLAFITYFFIQPKDPEFYGIDLRPTYNYLNENLKEDDYLLYMSITTCKDIYFHNLVSFPFYVQKKIQQKTKWNNPVQQFFYLKDKKISNLWILNEKNKSGRKEPFINLNDPTVKVVLSNEANTLYKIELNESFDYQKAILYYSKKYKEFLDLKNEKNIDIEYLSFVASNNFNFKKEDIDSFFLNNKMCNKSKTYEYFFNKAVN